jgi:thiol-disulfide isomerase/thioredoxin
MREIVLKRRLAEIMLILFIAAIAPLVSFAVEDHPESLPDISALDEKGNPVRFADLRGKIVVMNLWASWCEPCKKELPEINKLAEKYKDAVLFLAVNIDESRAPADRFLKGINPVHFRSVFDAKQAVPAAMKSNVMPVSYVIDERGKIFYMNKGYRSGDEKKLDQAIKALIESRFPVAASK